MCNSNIYSIMLFNSNLHPNKATYNQSLFYLVNHRVEVVQIEHRVLNYTRNSGRQLGQHQVGAGTKFCAPGLCTIDKLLESF